jgi:hypothetical protein
MFHQYVAFAFLHPLLEPKLWSTLERRRLSKLKRGSKERIKRRPPVSQINDLQDDVPATIVDAKAPRATLPPFESRDLARLIAAGHRL